MNWYGLIIATGIVVCVIAAYFTAKHRGLEGDIVIDLIVICLPLAIIGARVYHVVFDMMAGGKWTFTKFIGLDDGGLAGLAIYGGILGSLVGALIFHFIKTRKKLPENKRVNFWQIADLGFTFIILGQAIGRWANYSNLEDYGGVVTNPAWQWFPFALNVNGEWHYAHFVYESLWCAIGFGLLFFLYMGKRKSYDGFIISCYSIFYGTGRSVLESLRAQDVLMIGNVRVSLLVSILFVVGGIANIIVHIVLAKKNNKKVFIFVDQSKLDKSYYGYEKTKLYMPMPDITFRKDKKNKNSDREEIIFDESGVAIRQDAESAEVTEETNSTTVKAEKRSEKQPLKVTSEVEYEDKWDE